MLRSQLDRIVIRVIVAILLVVIAVFGWIVYHRYLRHSIIQAAKTGDAAAVKSLLARGVDPNTADDDPKISDVQNHHSDIVLPLNALDWAITNHHSEACLALLQKGAKVSTTNRFLAAADPDPRIALALATNGAHRAEILDAATQKGNAVLIREMFSRFPDLKALIEDKAMLADAAMRGNVALIQLLLDCGAFIDARDSNSATPLMRAAMADQLQATTLLLQHGADVYATTPEYRTAAYFCRLHPNPAEAELIQTAEAHAPPSEAQNLYDLNKQASILSYQGNSKAAMAVWRQIIARFPAVLEARYSLMNALLQQNQPKAALALMEQAVQLAPNSPHAHIYLGYVLWLLNKRDAACAELRTALRLNPREFIAHESLAILLDIQGKHTEAIAESRTLIAQNPANGTAHFWLGDKLYRQGDRKGAISECRRAIEMNPALGDAYVSLGWILLEDGQIPEAITACRSAVSHYPQDPNAHANLGKALTAQGDLNAAVAECRLALQLDPSFAEAHYNLGLALDKQGQRAQAITELQIYVRQAKKNPNERARLADARTHLQQWGAQP